MARDKKKTINSLVERLSNAMFDYWRMTRGYKANGRVDYEAGFEDEHEQELYDAVCRYRNREKTWSK